MAAGLMAEDRTRRIHQVSCSAHSDADIDSEAFQEVAKKAERLRRYARKLGFDVMYENVDHPEIGD